MNSSASNGSADQQPLIDLRKVEKAYKTDAGDFLALKGIDLTIERGEFVAVVGKSGSGKSTLINMLTGIDRPTGGEVIIGGTPIHLFNEGEMAKWRGRNQGVVFQFFQLLPTLTVVENVMLPMDFCNVYHRRERRKRAMQLLDMVDVADQAHKLPSMISGGQQQRVAIARALANDPPMILADEPTGNLDSRTAEHVYQLLEQMVADGKTILMVTHDDDMARRVHRTVVIADGEIVNEWLVAALPTLSQELMVSLTRQLQPGQYAPGAEIITQNGEPDRFYIVVEGQVEVYHEPDGGPSTFLESLSAGEYFGEISLLEGGARTATVRAAPDAQVRVVSLGRAAFDALIGASAETRQAIQHVASLRNQALQAKTQAHS